MLPYSFIGSGSYLNSATPVAQNIALNDTPDFFYVKNITNWGSASTADAAIYSEFYNSTMTPGSYLGLGQNSSATPASVTTYATQGATGGFTWINPNNPPSYPALTATAINNSTFVVSMANTSGISVGDIVRITTPTGMNQIGGLTFQVTAVSANTSITLGYMASAVAAGLSIAASATGAIVRKVVPNLFYPRKKSVLYVTQATQATVYFSEQNDFTPGEIVDFTIPTPYGMTQLSYLTDSTTPARVLSVTNSATVSSIVINVNTTGFTPFVYPTSAAIITAINSPATCYPAGSGIVPLNGSATTPLSPPGTNLLDAFDNRNQYFMNIGLSVVGAASCTMQWAAWKGDYSSALSNA
jgi:hypothetical protein